MKASKDGYPIIAVIEVMKNLFDDDVPEEDNVFTIKADEVMERSKNP